MADNNGISGGLEGTTLPLAMTLSAFTAIAWYNVVDLNVMIWITFKRRHGLYFYSLLASSWGVFIYALAFLMKFFQVWKNNYVSVALITIGWYAMVTGQSLVLYSRLHLVVRDKEKIKWVLWMIIVDVFLFHFPTTVLTFGVRDHLSEHTFHTLKMQQANSPHADIFSEPYSIMEKIQVTGFCIQEFIISGLYVYATRQILKPGETFQKKRFRRVMRHLIYVNILVILMDITLLGTEYANLYDIQITFKGTLYSIKLRLEFAILNQLRSIVHPAGTSHDNGNSSQTGGRDISLHTFRNQNALSKAPANGNSSTVYSSRLAKSPFSGDLEGNRVMMTTDVIVLSEEVDQEKKGSGDQTSLEDHDVVSSGDKGATANGRASRQKGSYSATSSEIEFAGAGY